MRGNGKKTFRKKNIEPIFGKVNEGDEIKKNWSIWKRVNEGDKFKNEQKKHSCKKCFYLLK